MKMRTSLGWILGMVLGGGAVASGFAQNDLNPAPTAVSSEKTGGAAPAPAAAASVEPGTAPQAASESSTAAPAAPGNSGDKSLSSNRYLSPWFYGIEQLTQAGVGEAVVLSYINSAGTFNLSADQVISLKNLGASPQVINAMMRHDRELISGQRPMPVSAPPPLPPSVQAALAASLHTTDRASAPPTTLATPAPAPSGSIVAPDDESGASGTWVWVEPDDVPDQPASAGPVRVPYAVKLNDPIIVLRLPTFALPCW
jgi:hypothetical protein